MPEPIQWRADRAKRFLERYAAMVRKRLEIIEENLEAATRSRESMRDLAFLLDMGGGDEGEIEIDDFLELAQEQSCRACGCTEETACETPDGPCSWAEPDLCSRCAPRVSNLELTPRAANALRIARVETIGALVALSFGELLRIRYIGRVSACEIVAALHRRGLTLRDLSGYAIPAAQGGA